MHEALANCHQISTIQRQDAMAAALQWRPPFYRRSVWEFHCFFVPPSISPFSLFPLPLTFLLYLCQKRASFFWSLQGSASSCFEGVPTQHGPPAWGEWRRGWPQTVIKPIQMQSVTCYILASVTPGRETSVKKGHRHRLCYRCHGKIVALASRVARQKQMSQSVVRTPAITITHKFRCLWVLNTILLAVCRMAVVVYEG